MKTLSILAMTLVFIAAQSALAHTELSATVPADRSTLAAAPEKLELEFSEPVRLTALTIQQGVAYFFQWLAAGIVIGLIYRPR